MSESTTSPVSRSTEGASLPTRALLLEAMMLMIAADGVVADEEIFEISRVASEHPIFEGTNATVIAAEFKRALGALAAEGFEARLQVLARGMQDYPTRLLAFTFATSICFADGVLAEQELDLLKAFQRVFGMRDEHVAEVISVVQEGGDVQSVLARLIGEIPADAAGLLSPQEALIEVMLLMAAADGEIQEVEVTRLALTVANHPLFKDMDEPETSLAISEALERVQSHGPESRLAELRLCLPDREDRLQALRFALGILIADDVIDAGETLHLHQLQSAFELDEDEVVALAAVIEAG